MYQRNNPLPVDYSEWAKTRTVYKCKRDINCRDGMFTKGSYVMLDVCSVEKGEIYVIDFASVLNHRIFDYTNDISDISGVNIEHDTAVLLPNQLDDCFDKVEELSCKINKHGKYVLISNLIACMIAIILMGFWLDTKSAAFVVAILITYIGVFGFNLAKSAKLAKKLECIITDENN